MRTTVNTLIVGLTAAATYSCVAFPAHADSLAEPSYQVKLKLNNTAVNDSGAPSEEFSQSFSVRSAPEIERSVYFDTPQNDYAARGWSIRLRQKEGDDSYDISYKYRQPLVSNSLSKSIVEDGLAEARRNNFDRSDTNYDAQVNASYVTSTLDFTNKKSYSCVQSQCELPSQLEAQAIVAELEPGKMTRAMGAGIAEMSPGMSIEVTQSTYRVEIASTKTDLEVSTFGDQVWVEISEEESSRKDAIAKRDALLHALDSKGFLAHEDAFKTPQVLSASNLATKAAGTK